MAQLFRNMFHIGFQSKKRFEAVTDTRSLTVPDFPTRIGDLLIAFNGRLNDLKASMNNGLVYESVGKKYFVDKLDKKDVDRINKLKADEERIAAEKVKNDELFAAWRKEYEQRQKLPPATPADE